jgi:hypothetical protein
MSTEYTSRNPIRELTTNIQKSVIQNHVMNRNHNKMFVGTAEDPSHIQIDSVQQRNRLVMDVRKKDTSEKCVDRNSEDR